MVNLQFLALRRRFIERTIPNYSWKSIQEIKLNLAETIRKINYLRSEFPFHVAGILKILRSLRYCSAELLFNNK